MFACKNFTCFSLISVEFSRKMWLEANTYESYFTRIVNKSNSTNWMEVLEIDEG